MTDQAGRSGGFRHAAWLYHAHAEYLGGIRDFVQAGLACNEPVFVVVPGSQLPGDWLPRGPSVTVADMRELGGNPARLIPALRAFADRFPGRRVRYLGEPAWAERSGAELLEAARHESLLNLAFADAQISALCLYNATDLAAAVLADACGAHPTLGNGDGERANADYCGPDCWPDSLAKPLVAPASAEVLVYDKDLRPVRAQVAAVAGQAGLSPARCTDLVIAASEVAANTLRHTRGTGVVRLWETDAEVLCQIEDCGHISNPLAGHWRPSGDVSGGQGLWLVNQLCDLAEIRSSELGTTIRLHMYRR
ncbi:MAG TPA: sensor histidine kinase [Streptosporangiaceae bacterium]|nr:sensor histidine kinase [Streptosporangiaceae bacterium]